MSTLVNHCSTVCTKVFCEQVSADGTVDGGDLALHNVSAGSVIGDAAYSADRDLNRDGSIDGADLAILFANWSPAALPEGRISAIGNAIGYSGYVYDAAADMSLARFRWFDAGLGRWVTRDPARYMDGNSLYEYVASVPILYIDPLGLARICWRPLRDIEFDLTVPQGFPLPLRYQWDGSPQDPDGYHSPFKYFPVRIRIPDIPILPSPLRPAHPQIFYDDGSGDNIGYFEDSRVRRDDADQLHRYDYENCESGYDDDRMRRSVAICSSRARFCEPDRYHVITNNCQAFIDCVKNEYSRLRRDDLRESLRDSTKPTNSSCDSHYSNPPMYHPRDPWGFPPVKQ